MSTLRREGDLNIKGIYKEGWSESCSYCNSKEQLGNYCFHLESFFTVIVYSSTKNVKLLIPVCINCRKKHLIKEYHDQKYLITENNSFKQLLSQTKTQLNDRTIKGELSEKEKMLIGFSELEDSSEYIGYLNKSVCLCCGGSKNITISTCNISSDNFRTLIPVLICQTCFKKTVKVIYSEFILFRLLVIIVLGISCVGTYYTTLNFDNNISRILYGYIGVFLGYTLLIGVMVILFVLDPILNIVKGNKNTIENCITKAPGISNLLMSGRKYKDATQPIHNNDIICYPTVVNETKLLFDKVSSLINLKK